MHWYADRGYLQIKIYNSMSPDWVKPLAAEAHALGLRTVGHVPAFTTPDRMIEDGYDEVTHINQLMLGWLLSPGEDTRTPLRLTAMARAADLDLADSKVRHTIGPHEGPPHRPRHDRRDRRAPHVGAGRDRSPRATCRIRTIRPSAISAIASVPSSTSRTKRKKHAYDKAFTRVMDTLALLHREGIRLWPGTDDATGFTVHRELELYEKIGMTPGEVFAHRDFRLRPGTCRAISGTEVCGGASGPTSFSFRAIPPRTSPPYGRSSSS